MISSQGLFRDNSRFEKFVDQLHQDRRDLETVVNRIYAGDDSAVGEIPIQLDECGAGLLLWSVRQIPQSEERRRTGLRYATHLISAAILAERVLEGTSISSGQIYDLQKVLFAHDSLDEGKEAKERGLKAVIDNNPQYARELRSALLLTSPPREMYVSLLQERGVMFCDVNILKKIAIAQQAQSYGDITLQLAAIFDKMDSLLDVGATSLCPFDRYDASQIAEYFTGSVLFYNELFKNTIPSDVHKRVLTVVKQSNMLYGIPDRLSSQYANRYFEMKKEHQEVLTVVSNQFLAQSGFKK